jgi:carbon storage regulator
MLVLRRKKNERILIGDDIVITLCASGDGGASIGVTAPPGVRIIRDELNDLAKLPESWTAEIGGEG